MINRKRKLSNESLDSDDLDLEDIFFVEQLAKLSKKPKKEQNVVNEDFQSNKLDNPLDYLNYQKLDVTGCVHEVIYSADYPKLKPRWAKPALQFPFTLDPFQNQAIQCIENDQSVLVSAHTSAGKTVCASYTIRMCLNANRRVIYTTPIKALSNQKYRDFLLEFKDVGLLTGDVTKNENASILIMTTEILRLLLYKNNELLREIGWIIFDEVHYMKDSERGYVWEESIIYVPRNVKMVFLSATIPNARQFAQWITHIHKQPCNIVYTEYRPTPLRHYLVLSCSPESFYQVVDENGYNRSNFQRAMCKMRENDTVIEKKTDETKKNFKLLISWMQYSNRFPMIVFSFSRKDCHGYAKLVPQSSLISDKQKKEVDEIWEKAISTLSDDDRQQLPQLDEMYEFLKRGIGIHHSGLLPVLKEVVEVLFGKSLLPLLFATDTFAMGINMPAKAVMFTSLTKFDGTVNRAVTGSEYIQMSGRAGRRGQDKYGEVFVLLKEGESAKKRIEENVLQNIIQGKSDSLISSFRLTYSMILNLMRVYAKNKEGEVITPRYLLKRSFKQFQAYADLSSLFDELKAAESNLSTFNKNNKNTDFTKIEEYVDLVKDIERIRKNMWDNLIGKDVKNICKIVTRGSIVKIKYGDNDFGWCVALTKPKHSDKYNSHVFACLVCVDQISMTHATELSMATPPTDQTFVYMVKRSKVFQVDWRYVVDVAAERIEPIMFYTSNKLDNTTKSQEHLTDLLLTKTLNKTSIELVDLKKSFGKDSFMTKNKNWANGISKLSKRKKKLAAIKEQLKDIDTILSAFNELKILKNRVDTIKQCVESRLAIVNCRELDIREKILIKFGHLEKEAVTGDFVVSMKGRVASNINNGDCLVLTELLFNNQLSGISDAAIASLVSSFIIRGQSDKKDKSTEEKPEMQIIKDKLQSEVQEQARYIAEQSINLGLTMIGDPENYAESFNSKLFKTVMSWARGAPFQVISQHKKCGGRQDNAEIPDGHLIRGIRRTAELLLDLCEASKEMNCVEMEELFASAIRKIKRDIVSASSLYINDDLKELL